MISSNNAVLLLSACLSISNVASFAPASPSAPVAFHRAVTPFSPSRQVSALSMAGFGAASPKKQKKKAGSKLPKLKAKSQWDRYKDLKDSEKITVGVRITGDDASSNEWMEVGRVRSEDNATEVAIARQRAMIAEHSKRLYPVQIPANAVLEWGYLNGEEWTAVDKSKGDDAPNGIEKKMGFEGISDKATGFYCFFHEGRIVEKEEDGMGTRGSGFAAVKGK
eukprot:CAMPEP_0172310014 /NCGR_PEP_ID=MMETSP1058-20130122/11117_1 /TAXON_ID=83371 /ORGANISM="Detonula confervacea, Strain CCMP 353" /LENGTH=221 /DNA_ID=CAMNT_0013022757 /DNA_START=48 /DNA_END=713 /DNA_ORIENTATION=-